MSDPQVVLVTGGNKGIGLEAVKYLSQKKSNDIILLASRSVKNAEEAVEKLKSSQSSHQYSNIEIVQLDVTDSASLEALVDHVKTKYGKLDALVHNSAVIHVDGDTLSPQVLEINIRGSRDTIEAFLPLIPRNTGRISLVASEAGAWYMNTLEEPTRTALSDVENVNWEKVEHWVEDWTLFSKGQQSELKWVPIDNAVGEAYYPSKAILTSWARAFAIQHPEVKLAIVCPGHCATEMNGYSGPRPASAGGESISWPVLNEFESGHFYQDGKEHPFVKPAPDYFGK
jgi:NAD(P)-dependent dehydrogenase (short-subunit alcohol dehydrogenase family)